MNKSIVVIVAVVALIAGAHSKVLQLSPRSNSISNEPNNLGGALKMFTEAFRSIMPCGSTKFGIPVLAPFQLEYLPFNYSTDYLKVSGSFSNLVMTGLNKWRLLGGHYDDLTNISYYDIVYPEIHILAENTLDFWAFVGGFPAAFKVDGLIDVKLIDYRIVGSFGVGVSPTNPNGLEVTNFHVNFSFGDIVFNSWNNLWNIAANNFVNKSLRESLLMWSQQIQPQTDEIYNAMVVPMINNSIKNITLTELIDSFTYLAMEYNNVDCTLTGNFFD